MNYRSIADLSQTIKNHLHLLPGDVDLVVCVPRSGLLAGNMLALNLNVKCCDLNSFLHNLSLEKGQTRVTRFPNLINPADAGHVLVVDDSVLSGSSMREVKSRVVEVYPNSKVTYCAIYAVPESDAHVDLFFEIVKRRRVFEWNMMHREFLSECCLDLDGVLCIKPTDKQTQSESNYLEYIANANPLTLPSYRVGHIVTSRLEKYRQQTVAWLKHHQVDYDELHMLNLDEGDDSSQQPEGYQAAFKAQVYKKLTDTRLFVESESTQAIEISNLSGKPVLGFDTQELFKPDFSIAFVQEKRRAHFVKAHKRIKRVVHKAFGQKT